MESTANGSEGCSHPSGSFPSNAGPFLDISGVWRLAITETWHELICAPVLSTLLFAKQYQRLPPSWEGLPGKGWCVVILSPASYRPYNVLYALSTYYLTCCKAFDPTALNRHFVRKVASLKGSPRKVAFCLYKAHRIWLAQWKREARKHFQGYWRSS